MAHTYLTARHLDVSASVSLAQTEDKALHPKIVEDKVDIKITRISLDMLLAVNECKTSP